MPEIPQRIKMKGNWVRVFADSRHAEIRIGKTTVSMDDKLCEQLNAMPYKDHIGPWDAEMFKLYEQALKLERKRLNE